MLIPYTTGLAVILDERPELAHWRRDRYHRGRQPYDLQPNGASYAERLHATFIGDPEWYNREHELLHRCWLYCCGAAAEQLWRVVCERGRRSLGDTDRQLRHLVSSDQHGM